MTRATVTLIHPKTAALLTARDALLTRELRDGAGPYGIAREYPLVLAPAAARFSYCLPGAGRETVDAHANLWPRMLVAADGRRLPVGLVGNVATDARCQGKGLMTAVLGELEAEARRQGLKALLLWSDLQGFYQKRGFRSCGREWRYGLGRDALPDPAGFAAVPAGDPRRAEAALAAAMRLRPATGATLARSPAEFAALLTIPETAFFAAEGRGYVVVGKGRDMQGVAHEWGGVTLGDVLAGCAAACDTLGLEGLLLLSPVELALGERCEGVEEHPMCWIKELDITDENERSAMESAFVWGLDSI